MSFTKLTENVNYIQALDDLPNENGGLTSSELKAEFDKAGNTNKNAFNNLVDELGDELAASNIGAEGIYEGDEDGNVQGKLEYLYEAIQGVVAGAVPENTITEAQLVSTYSSTLAKKQDLGMLYLASKYTAVTGGETPTTYVTPSLTTASPQGYTVTLETGNASEVTDIYTMIGGNGSLKTSGEASGGEIMIKVNFPHYTNITSISGKYQHSGSSDYYERISVYGSNDGSNFTQIYSDSLEGSYSTQVKTFTVNINNTKYYKQYRIKMEVSRGNYNYVYNNFSFSGTTITTLTQNYVLSSTYTNETLAAYVEGQVVKIKTPSSTPAGSTVDNYLNVYGLGNKKIDKALEPSTRYSLIYDGTKFIEE